MRLTTALAIAGLCIFGMIGTASAARDAEESARCVECHDENALPDLSRSAHAVGSDARTPTCVTCHGSSKAHLRRGGTRPHTARVFRKNGG